MSAALQRESEISAEASSPGRTLSRRGLYERVWPKPMTAVAADLKLSRNGLAKICDRMLIPYPGRGYWKRSQPGDLRPPLPPPPADGTARVVISGERAKSRRLRTRLAPEARAEQLVEVAGRIVAREGLAAATTG